ncbi:MAG: hypothetical protein K2L13_01655 [Opitutales bacterium]|nr:hypothetical protein [Opitutales bacterium]
MNNMEWIKLVDFGQYQHPKGLQVVDRDSAESMVKYFHSLRGRLMRRFLGLPIYVGHPDDPNYLDSTDRTIYGRIENLKIEDDALWMLSRWTSIGKKIFGEKFLKYLSPRWMMKKLSDKIFSPVRLLSVGMTNHPNVRCEHTVTTIDNNDDKKLFEPVDDEQVMVRSSKKDLTEVLPKDTEESNVKIDNDKESELSSPSEPASDVSEAVVPSPEIMKPETFDTSSANDGEVPEPQWHTCALTNHLIERRPELDVKDKILRLVYDHMGRTGDSYQASWATVKRQNPGLFR